MKLRCPVCIFIFIVWDWGNFCSTEQGREEEEMQRLRVWWGWPQQVQFNPNPSLYSRGSGCDGSGMFSKFLYEFWCRGSFFVEPIWVSLSTPDVSQYLNTSTSLGSVLETTSWERHRNSKMLPMKFREWEKNPLNSCCMDTSGFAPFSLGFLPMLTWELCATSQ